MLHWGLSHGDGCDYHTGEHDHHVFSEHEVDIRQLIDKLMWLLHGAMRNARGSAGSYMVQCFAASMRLESSSTSHLSLKKYVYVMYLLATLGAVVVG